MGISDMHIMFRQYVQQMGMQNVRAILPEQIDLLINNSINDTINQIITQNVGITNDRVITDNSKLNQINALRSLYKVWKGNVKLGTKKTSYVASYNLPMSNFKTISNITVSTKDSKDSKDYDEYTAKYSDGTTVTYKKGNFVYTSDTKCESDDIDGNHIIVTYSSISYIYIVDLNIDYTGTNDFITNIFPIRIIDDAYLADVVNDFILAPRLRSPVASIHDDLVELYIDKPDSKETDTFKGLSVNNIRLSYVSKPAVVKFVEDVNGSNVDCDLPEYLHVDIVKHAVELYRIALTGSIAVTQAAQQQQQRENTRNNYRPSDNDSQSN